MIIKIYIILQLWIPFAGLSACRLGGGSAKQVPQEKTTIEVEGKGSACEGRQSDGLHADHLSSPIRQSSPMVKLGKTSKFRLTAKASLRADGLVPMAALGVTTPRSMIDGHAGRQPMAALVTAPRPTRGLGLGARMRYYRRRALQIINIGAWRRADATVKVKKKPQATSSGNATKELATLDMNNAGDKEKNKYTFPERKTRKRKPRTTAARISLTQDCDYLIYYCLKAYDTGTICARTSYYKYETFKNYCVMDFVNCMELYELWQVVHMGACIPNVDPFYYYEPYPYMDDYFMDQMYVLEF